jgi:hypothetical protein
VRRASATPISIGIFGIQAIARTGSAGGEARAGIAERGLFSPITTEIMVSTNGVRHLSLDDQAARR